MMPITETAVRDALRQVIDPELGTNIVDLGLVYGIEIDGARVRVVMTMTSPACPLGDYLKDLVDSMVKWRVREVEDVEIVLVWEPRWNPDMMSPEAHRQLNGGTQ
jgi:metal-sulfur cluster biosynthetic enzyme